MGLRLICALVGVVLGATAINLLESNLPSVSLISIAKQVEAGIVLDRDSASKIAPLLNRQYSCRRDIQRAFLTLHLALLDQATKPEATVEETSRTYKAASDHLKRQLGCAPLDGNAWLRLAMLELVFSGPTKNAIEYVKLSQQTSPYEEWILGVRLPILVSLARTHDDLVQRLLENDLNTLLQYGRPPLVRAIWKRLGSFGRGLMTAQASQLSPERRQILQRIFDKSS